MLNKTDKVYHDLLTDILENGHQKGDRTGTGTTSVYGRQIRFNMKEGFPMLSTKKLHTKSILHELLFFLNGETNIGYLKDNGVSIWNEWADENGNLGPVYGAQWCNWGGKVENVPQPIPRLDGYSPTIYNVAHRGDLDKSSDRYENLFTIWKGMISRCYNKSDDKYQYYGQKGVHVNNDWLVFSNFYKDSFKLDGMEAKLSEWDNFNLDKDLLGNGFIYSKDTCQWVSKSRNIRAKYNTLYKVKHDDGREDEFINQIDFIDSNNVNQGNFSSMLRGSRDQCEGWRLLEKIDYNKGINQIEWLMKRLEEAPDCRRMIVSAWNVADLPEMALMPCHYGFQVWTRELSHDERLLHFRDNIAVDSEGWPGEDGPLLAFLDEKEVPKREISLMMNQRSVDTGLGLPFNIASYAFLLHMIAQQVNMVPGELIMNLGDTHIYSNHIDPLKEQLKRESIPECKPKLVLNKAKDIFSYKYEDFIIEGYIAHPSIKMDISV